MKIYIIILTFFVLDSATIYCQCSNLHYQPVDCLTYENVISTTIPLDDGCEHWPAPTYNNDPHIAKYQNQLTINPPSGADRTIQFSANDAQTLMDWARGFWSLQCSTPRGLVWQTTTTGGSFYWEDDPAEIEPYVLGETFATLDPNNITILVDASNCMPNESPISKIIFNNTSDMYRTHPEWRWTTTPNACNGTQFTCLDFQTLALHELGHYVGLAHDGSQTSVMAETYRGRIVVFEMCDVDRFRRLYCLASVGNPPVGVKEQISTEAINLEIFPQPSRDIITVSFNNEKQERISIYISDLFGNITNLIADEIFSEGNHTLSYPTYDIPSGTYFIQFEFVKSIISEKFIIIK